MTAELHGSNLSQNAHVAAGKVVQRLAPAEKFSAWLRATEEFGILVTQEMAAAALEVSRQRVHQLISAGRLETVRVGSDRYVPLSKLEEFRVTPRRPGRRRRGANGILAGSFRQTGRGYQRKENAGERTRRAA